MNRLLLLNESDIQGLLGPRECVNALDAAMRAVSQGAVAGGLRSFVPLNRDGGSLGMMPAICAELSAFSVKVLSLIPENPVRQLPAVQGQILLFDLASGRPTSLLDAASVTALRTAAASALATRELAREDVRSHGILGTGVQAESHARAVLDVRPSLQRLLLWGRDNDKAHRLASKLATTVDQEIRVVGREEASGCDVVSAVTGSRTPIIERAFVAPGAHINLVGSHSADRREASSETIAAGRVYVDARDSAMAEAGDLCIPIAEGVIDESHMRGEIGEVLTGTVPGRESSDDLTIYKSVGCGAQDLFVAVAAAGEARSRGVGQWVDWR